MYKRILSIAIALLGVLIGINHFVKPSTSARKTSSGVTDELQIASQVNALNFSYHADINQSQSPLVSEDADR